MAVNVNHCVKEGCFNFFSFDLKHRWQMYCSHRCASKVGPYTIPALKKCARLGCPNVFRPEAGPGSRRKYCSRTCNDKAHNMVRDAAIELERQPRPCVYCSTVFKPLTQSTRYCSKQCYSKYCSEERRIRGETYPKRFYTTAAEVRELFDYNPLTGELIAKVKQHTRYIGKAAGATVLINGVSYLTHRIIWLHYYGEWPSTPVVDHKDGNPRNNRIDNLREATYQQNGQNKAAVNVHGHKGITFIKGRGKPWSARITLGSFSTKEEAAEAYEKACKLYHGEFASFRTTQYPAALSTDTGPTSSLKRRSDFKEKEETNESRLELEEALALLKEIGL